ncbi:MAG: hypothetical protein ACOVSV_01880 [Fimbriimonadaceae bacterium]
MAKKPQSPESLSFAAGLRWLAITAPAGSSAFRKQLREHAEALDAHGHVANPLEPGIVGLWSSRRRGQGRGRSKVHSFAVAALGLAASAKVSLAATAEDINTGTAELGVALLLQGKGDRWSLAIIVDNAIVVDREDTHSACIEQIQTVCKPDTPWLIYSNADTESLGELLPDPKIEQIDWEELAAVVADDKTSLIQPIPRSRTLVLGVIAGALVTVAIGGWYFLVHQPEVERMARVAAMKGDNTDAYVLAADTELKQGGWDREDLSNRISEISKIPISDRGWATKEVSCEIASASCNLYLTRAGGTSETIANGWGNYIFLPALSKIDSAVLEERFPAQKTGWDRSQIQSNQQTQLSLQPIAQQLINAGLQFKATEASRWAALNLDVVDPSAVLSRFQVEVSGPMHRAQEVLKILPPSILLMAVTINVESVSIDTPQVGFRLKGYVYVK